MVNNSFIFQRHSSLLLIAALPICKYLMRKHSIMHNSHICVGSWLEYKYLTLADFQVFRLRYCIVILSLPSCLFIYCHAIMSFIWIILIILGHPLSNLVIILPSCCNKEKPQKIFFLLMIICSKDIFLVTRRFHILFTSPSFNSISIY